MRGVFGLVYGLLFGGLRVSQTLSLLEDFISCCASKLLSGADFNYSIDGARSL